MNSTLASALHRAAAPAKSARLASPRHHNLPTLRSIVATWEERKRFRWDLEQMSKDSPHLIDDIGLTGRQVAAEIAKPFWQA